MPQILDYADRDLQPKKWERWWRWASRSSSLAMWSTAAGLAVVFAVPSHLLVLASLASLIVGMLSAACGLITSIVALHRGASKERVLPSLSISALIVAVWVLLFLFAILATA